MQYAGDIRTFSNQGTGTDQYRVVFPTINKYPPVDNMASLQMQRVGLQKLAA